MASTSGGRQGAEVLTDRAGEVPPRGPSGSEGYTGAHGGFEKACFPGDHVHHLAVEQRQAGDLGQLRPRTGPQAGQGLFQDGGHGPGRVAASNAEAAMASAGSPRT